MSARRVPFTPDRDHTVVPDGHRPPHWRKPASVERSVFTVWACTFAGIGLGLLLAGTDTAPGIRGIGFVALTIGGFWVGRRAADRAGDSSAWQRADARRRLGGSGGGR